MAQQPLLSLRPNSVPARLSAVAFSAEEAISTPFRVTLELQSDNHNIPSEAVLHQPLCLQVSLADRPVRFFHGVVQQFASRTGSSTGPFTYYADLVPQLWFMSQTEDCRVFQDQTADQIVSTLLDEAGVTNTTFSISGEKSKRPYTVQMNETDLEFISRLMQEEGWFYFFRHTESAHELVIANHNGVFSRLADPLVRLDEFETGGRQLLSWSPSTATTYGEAILKDFDPETPNKHLLAQNNTVRKESGTTKRDLFRWPALSFDPGRVKQRSRFLIEAAEASVSLIDGVGIHAGFIPGGKFVLERDPQTGAINQEHVIRSVVHRGSVGLQVGQPETTVYSNSFSCFPSGQIWRDFLTVSRPRMEGVYSAIVIGPDGEEIHTDEYGRIKVLFPWDRRRDSNPDKSIWVRVVQPWAGHGWGWQFLPRVGSEVAIVFIDGDIDRPMAIGGLFNGDDMPIFPLTAQKTKSGLRTRSTPKGSVSNYSEFSIDDQKGQEVVFLHAEKNHTVEVEHDQNLRIDNCRIKRVGADETVTIGGNQTIKIGPFDPAKAGGDQTVEVWSNRSVKIDQGNDSLLLQQGDLSTKLSMGNMSIELSLGNLSTKASVGKIDENAMQSITMTVGSSSIKLDQTGVTISGMMVKIQGQLMATTAAPMVQLSADAMLTAKGGIVLIN